MRQYRVYQILARAIGAKARCETANNAVWVEKWSATIDAIVDQLPHGSGFDSGTQLDSASTPEKLVFTTAFHHMNESGCYDDWTQHQVIVTPSLEMGYRMRITGKNRNDIKQYIHEMFSYVLDAEKQEFSDETLETTGILAEVK